LAVASRQFYVAYPVGLLAASVFSGSPRPLSRMVALFLPLGTLMLLALVWGGLTPPAMQQKFGHRSIHPEQFGFFLLWLGFWFAPVALDTIRRSPRMLWIGAVGLALAIVLGVDYAQAAGETEGVLPKLLAGMTAAGAPAPLVKSGQAILVGSGCLVATRLFRAPDRDLVWIAAVHAGIMLTVPYAWERYYLPVTPVIWLALLPGTTSWGTRWLTVWASVQTVLTLAYCAYKWGWRFP
jgi:hypothetical protein